VKNQKKTTIKLRSSISFFLFALIALHSFQMQAQIELVPLSISSSNKSLPSARTQEVKPKKLPFWDDFSFVNTTFPQDSLWQFGKTVWVNNGLGINPPSLGVVTFDGLDSLGKPYNVNDVLAKGYADKLTSQPIKMDLVDPAQRSTVYISFYYQAKGRGEAPDTGDLLRLQFRNKTGGWETIWSVENNVSLDPNVFYNVILPVPVTDDRFFYDSFRFRFQNFARLSGKFDTWNIDYVYLNKDRSASDANYPDRSITTKLTPLFGQYTSLPLKHFLSTTNQVSKPNFIIYSSCPGDFQPISFYSSADLSLFKNGIKTTSNIQLENASNNAVTVSGLGRTSVVLNVLPDLITNGQGTDSMNVKLNVLINSDDETIQSNAVCDPSRYPLIDFRVNDTTSTVYTLSNYYAYDDGTAEYGAGVNQPGAQLMYKFDMKTTEPETIGAVQMYFPRFGDETSQVIQLQILKDLEGTLGSTLYAETVPVQRSEQDKFSAPIPLNRFVTVSGSFYVGWKQNTATVIPVGLDKNTDSGDNIYFNTNGVWEQNTNVRGSLMIRPIFGKGGPNVGLEEEMFGSKPYPNPNKGNFFLPGAAESIKIFDGTGRDIAFAEERSGNEKSIQLQSAGTGLYIVHYFMNGAKRSEKIIVRQ
jgi:hypothetical protein